MRMVKMKQESLSLEDVVKRFLLVKEAQHGCKSELVESEYLDIVRGALINCKYDLTVEMYKTFGDVVIDVFFELGNSVNKSTNASLKRWSGLCAKNQKLSVSKLTRIEDATLFEVVILGIFFTLKHIFSLTSGSKNCVATAAGI